MMTNITIARSLLLLLFLIGCRHAIDVYDEIEYDDGSTRLQLRTSRSFEISQIFCNSTSPQTDEADVFNYDCSNRTLKWSSLRRLMDHVRASTNLNLGNNLLGEESPVAANLSFNLFKQLKRLDVSANGLEAADLHAFFYTDQVSDTVNTSASVPVKPLSLVTLNLTFNRFVRLPWLAIRRLHDLEVLDLSGNPLSAFDFGDWNPTTDDESVQNWELFQSLKEIYVRSAEIERVDAGIFSYLTQLIKLDLSQNKLRHLSVDLRQPLESLGDFKELNVNKNPLVCDCHLIWLKEFFAYKGMKSEASCLINTREPNVNAIVETNLVYINSSYKTQQNYFKVTKIRNDPSRRENGLGESETRLTELRDDQFYCNMKLSGDVKDMTILKESKQQMIYITCSVRSYPAAKIMWLLGQRHLVKTSLYENTTQFSTLSKFSKLEAHYASVYNATEHLYTLNSTLQVSYYGHIGKVNFSCVSSYNKSAPSPTVASKPEHLLQTIQFNVNSDDDLLDLVDGSSNDYVVNSTVLMMKEAVGIEHSSMFHNRPVIYWVLLVICIVFVISVAIVLLSVCTVRRCRHNKRKERESEVPNYAYSTYTASNYSTINKRSALYLNKTPTLQMHQHYHNNPTLGKSPIAADLSSCSSAMIPLKPDVIREHKDHSSIYYRMGTTSRGGHLSSTPSNDEYSSRRSTPAPHQQHFGSSAISKHSYDRRTEPSSIISRNNGTNTMSTPSTTEESVSSTSTASSKRESTRSSKSFDEENIEEYLEPECPDLSKPPPKNHKSSSPDS